MFKRTPSGRAPFSRYHLVIVTLLLFFTAFFFLTATPAHSQEKTRLTPNRAPIYVSMSAPPNTHIEGENELDVVFYFQVSSHEPTSGVEIEWTIHPSLTVVGGLSLTETLPATTGESEVFTRTLRLRAAGTPTHSFVGSVNANASGPDVISVDAAMFVLWVPQRGEMAVTQSEQGSAIVAPSGRLAVFALADMVRPGATITLTELFDYLEQPDLSNYPERIYLPSVARGPLREDEVVPPADGIPSRYDYPIRAFMIWRIVGTAESDEEEGVQVPIQPDDGIAMQVDISSLCSKGIDGIGLHLFWRALSDEVPNPNPFKQLGGMGLCLTDGTGTIGGGGSKFGEFAVGYKSP